VGVAIAGFFSEEEISAAKTCLFTELEPLKLEGMPRYKPRKQSDMRKKHECEDLLQLYAFADAAKCQLPTFVAANLKRLPSVTPGDVDICTMAASVVALTAQLEALTTRVNNCPLDSFSSFSQRLDAFEAKLSQTNTLTVSADANSAATSRAGQDASATPLVQWSTVVKKPAAVRVKGSAVQGAVKAVPRSPKPKVLQAFVGRMHIETTADDLSSFLKDAGLEVVSCSKLKPPNGKTFQTSAFYVACMDTEDNGRLFYDESTWPDGAELRDWYVKS
jgi:hypothetical protein